MLSKLHKLELVPKHISADKTLRTLKARRFVCYVHKAYQHDRFEPTLDLILYANVHLAAQQSINIYIISRLTDTLRLEQKRRKKGCKLNLFGKDDKGP